MPNEASRNIDENQLPILPYITFHAGSYVVNLPDFLERSAKGFAIGDDSPSQAQEKARQYRDSKLPASHQARVTRREKSHDTTGRMPPLRGVTARSKMTLGRPGINIVRTRSNRSITYSVRATAKDYIADETQTRRFSIERYGLEPALRYAIRFRLEWERTLYGHKSCLSESDWVRFMLYAYDQLGGEAFELRQLKHRGCGRDHRDGWLTASLNFHNEPYLKGFNIRTYSSKHEAWVAAILCCLDWQTELGANRHRLLSRASSRNVTTGHAGVCRRRINDRRGKSPLIAYEALVYVNGQRKPIRFSAGREHRITAMHDLAAFEAALACRLAYETADKKGEVFDHRSFSDWKERFNYPNNSPKAKAA